jgi:hypothetical protein
MYSKCDMVVKQHYNPELQKIFYEVMSIILFNTQIGPDNLDNHETLLKKIRPQVLAFNLSGTLKCYSRITGKFSNRNCKI